MPHNDSNCSEDFVFIDGPVDTLKSFHIVSADDYAKSPVEAEADSDFVTVDNNGLIISAIEDAPDAPDAPVAPVTPVAPIDTKPTQPIDVFVKELVHLDGFGPFLLSCFPDTITQVLLLAPNSIKGQATVGEVGGQHSPAKAHAFLVKNTKLILECFFHFKDLNPKFGRDRTLYIVGKACKINLAKRRSLGSHVGDILGILKGSRLMFLRAKEKKSIPVADDPDVRELAKLVDQYIGYKWEEPKPGDIATRGPRWCDDPVFMDLWSGWRKRISAAEGQKDTARPTDTGPKTTSEPDTVLSEAWLAVGKLEHVLIQLETPAGSGNLTEPKKRSIGEALERVSLLTGRIKICLTLTEPKKQSLREAAERALPLTGKISKIKDSP